MRTTSLCIRGVTEKSPYAYRDAKIPVCIRGLVSIRSPYAYRDCANPRMHTGIKINPCMHTGITYKSPYAYRDYMTCNPRMHTGIDLDHRMHTGIFAIPVCIRGLITGEGGRGCEGEGEASEGERARADEGARARAIVDMADNNGKQQKRASTGRRGGVALK